ncbi:hypothetical protein WDU94_005894 [Cyamophila willieti]
MYILNAGSYVPDIEPSSRDSLWRSCIILLSCLPLPPPLPPSMASTLVHLLQTDNVKTARSILNTLPKLVPHLSPDQNTTIMTAQNMEDENLEYNRNAVNSLNEGQSITQRKSMNVTLNPCKMSNIKQNKSLETQLSTSEALNENVDPETSTPWVHFVNTSLNMIKTERKTSNFQSEYQYNGNSTTWMNRKQSNMKQNKSLQTQLSTSEALNTNVDTETSTPWVHFVNTSLNMIKTELKTSNFQSEYQYNGNSMTWMKMKQNKSLQTQPCNKNVDPETSTPWVHLVNTSLNIIKTELKTFNFQSEYQYNGDSTTWMKMKQNKSRQTQPCNTNVLDTETSTPWVHFVNSSLNMIKTELETSNFQSEYQYNGNSTTWMNPNTLSSLSHTVFSLWSRKFKPNPVLLNAVLALTSRRGPNNVSLLVLEYDLLEDVHTRVKQAYVSLECSHGDAEINSELNIYLQLLNNILTQDIRVCEIAAKSGLADTLHKLIGWIHNHETTLDTMLHVMASFTANCIQACNSFVHTSSLIGSGLSKSVSSSSLVHCLISLIQSSHNAGVRVQCLLILSQLMVSNECRHIVSKSTLWDHLLQPAPNSLSPPVESAWTRFLRSYSLNLSPHNTTITPNLTDILIEKSYSNLHYFIVLTNLTFHSTYQTKLKGNSNLTKLVTDIFSGSELVSVNRYVKAIQSRLSEIENGEMDGKSSGGLNDTKSEIRNLNEKLFRKYGELIVFENTLHVERRKKGVSIHKKPHARTATKWR